MSPTIRERCDVHVRGRGSTTLVLAHGLASEQSVWEAVADLLATRARVVTFDYPGAGSSDPAAWDPKRHGSLEGYADELLAVVEEFGGEKPIVVGHSISGAIALVAAAREPDRFEKVVALAPSPRYLDDPPGYRGGFTRRDVEELFTLMEQNFIGWAAGFAPVVAPQADVAARMKRVISSANPRWVRSFAEVALTSDIRALLPRVAVPTLVVQCVEDAIVPVHVGQWMASQLPHGTYRQLDVAGHFPQLSAPPLVASVIEEYVGAA